MTDAIDENRNELHANKSFNKSTREAQSGGAQHSRLERTMNTTMQLAAQQHAELRLRREYARDPLIRAAIQVDLAIRRAALRILARLNRVTFSNAQGNADRP
jgi:hypothetical protein